MRGDASTMTVFRPRTAAEAVRRLAAVPGALPLAGGTDLMVAWNMGGLNGRTVIDLSRIAGWTRVSVDREVVTLGALVTHAGIQRHAAVRGQLPLLVESCATIGGVQIQNRGTLGGNIANASPAADTLPALAVYEAAVATASPDGPRLRPLLEVFTGAKRTALERGELIASVVVPRPARAPDRQMFRKVGTRASQAISKVVIAGAVWLDAKGSVEDARLAVGSVAPTVRRLRGVEAFLRGQRLTPGLASSAAALVAQDITPIDDVRSTADYRRLVTANLVAQFLS